jgi:acylphosphatase
VLSRRAWFTPSKPASPTWSGWQSGLPYWFSYCLGGASVKSVTDDVRLTAWIEGRVQGVGFRWWTRREAAALELSGTARNLRDGRVEVVAEGSRVACEALLDRLESDRTPGYVRTVKYEWSAASGNVAGFSVR